MRFEVERFDGQSNFGLSKQNTQHTMMYIPAGYCLSTGNHIKGPWTVNPVANE